MHEIYAKFDFNVYFEIEDINDKDEIKNAVIDCWTNTTELPDYTIIKEDDSA